MSVARDLAVTSTGNDDRNQIVEKVCNHPINMVGSIHPTIIKWRRGGDSVTTASTSRRYLRHLPYAHCRKHPVCSSDIKSAFASLRIPAKLILFLSYHAYLTYSCSCLLNGGEAGIRTPGSVNYTRFPGEHHRPLGHLSANWEPYTNRLETVKGFFISQRSHIDH